MMHANSCYSCISFSRIQKQDLLLWWVNYYGNHSKGLLNVFEHLQNIVVNNSQSFQDWGKCRQLYIDVFVLQIQKNTYNELCVIFLLQIQKTLLVDLFVFMGKACCTSCLSLRKPPFCPRWRYDVSDRIFLPFILSHVYEVI